MVDSGVSHLTKLEKETGGVKKSITTRASWGENLIVVNKILKPLGSRQGGKQ